MPKEIYTISTANDINACSIVLYVITERWPGARRYRDIFEAIKQSVQDTIEEGDYCPRRPIKRLKPNLHETLRHIQPSEGGRDDFSALVAEMSGNQASFVYNMELATPAILPEEGSANLDFDVPLNSIPIGEVNSMDNHFDFLEQQQGQEWLLQADFDATAGFLIPDSMM